MTSRPKLLVSLFAGAMLLTGGAMASAQQTPRNPGATAATPAAQGMAKATFLTNVDAEFAAIDANKDGKASKGEIEQHRTRANAAQLQQQNLALFARLDQDKNGSISQQEFARLARPRGAPNAEPLIARMDSDRDQQVSRAEYRAGAQADFERLDTNRDGRLTPVEARQANRR